MRSCFRRGYDFIRHFFLDALHPLKKQGNHLQVLFPERREARKKLNIPKKWRFCPIL